MSPPLPFGAEVRGYLDDCAAYPDIDRRHHPTANGAVKVIFHRGLQEADQIRHTFAALAGVPAAHADDPNALATRGKAARPGMELT